MHTIDFSLLCYCFVLYIVKKKQPIHPRLYISVKIDSDKVIHSYVSNFFDENNNRIVSSESDNVDKNVAYDLKYLTSKNETEYTKLKKYVKIQKNVLEKHQKARNYDSCKVVESSILLMNEFKQEFEFWFKDNESLQ